MSRATAYRYFPSVEALLVEAALDLAVPEADDLFGGDASADDPVARLERVDTALHDMILANEPPLRLMLAHSLQRGLKGDDGPPAAPEPPHAADRGRARAGAQAVQARRAGDADQGARPDHGHRGDGRRVKDVLQLDDAEARKVKRWAIRALVEAAKKPGARQ